MPYYTPPGGDITAAYGRSLMGLGAPIGYYAPNFRRTLNGLGALRFNRAVARGIYTLPFQEVQPRRQLGQFDPTAINLTDPATLLMLVGGAFLAWNLFKGTRRVARGVSKYRRRRKQRQSRRRAFEADLPFGGVAGGARY